MAEIHRPTDTPREDSIVYVHDLDTLNAQGYSDSQVELVRQLRERDISTQSSLVREYVDGGMSRDDAKQKARTLLSHVDARRAATIREEGISTLDQLTAGNLPELAPRPSAKAEKTTSDEAKTSKLKWVASLVGRKTVAKSEEKKPAKPTTPKPTPTPAAPVAPTTPASASPEPTPSPEPAKEAEPEHSPEPAKEAAPAPSAEVPANQAEEKAEEEKQPAKNPSEETEKAAAIDIEHPDFRRGRRIVLTEADKNQIIIEDNEIIRLHRKKDGEVERVEKISYMAEDEALPHVPEPGNGQIWKFVSIEDGSGKEITFESQPIIGLEIFEQAKTASKKSSDDSEPEDKPDKQPVATPEPAQPSRRQRAFAAAKKRTHWVKSHTPEKIKSHRKIVAASLAGILAIGGVVGGLEATSGHDRAQTITQNDQKKAQQPRVKPDNRPNVTDVNPTISYAPDGTSASITLK